MVEILMPYAEPPASLGAPLATRLASLRGRTVGVVNNSWRCMNVVSDELHTQLTERFGVATLLERRISAAQTLPPETMDEMARACDAVVVGIGN